MSAIYKNAVDSLRIGMEFFLKEQSYSSRKHAILTIFHAVELFLKERLSRTNSILIYKNIDAKITDDALTVSIRESLTRLENLGLGIPAEYKKIIESIQRIRNRIEHHRYDHNEQEDEAIIASSLKFILYFVELVLEEKLEDHIEGAMLRDIIHRVFEYNERQAYAEFRFNALAHKEWPDWKEEEEDSPDDFWGTLRCPECHQDWLVIGYHEKPFCFHCNTSINADSCDDCGDVFLVPRGCSCGTHKAEDDGRVDAIFDRMRGRALREEEEKNNRSTQGRRAQSLRWQCEAEPCYSRSITSKRVPVPG